MSDRVVVASTSLAEDAAYLTMQDAVAAANRTGIEYRIIGGQMVTVHVATSGADAPLRMTTDTDLGLEARVLANSGLIDQLRDDGYELVAGNRLERDGGTRAIDVLIPADTSRARHNRQVGELFVDEVLGLRYALSREPLVVNLQVRLSTGDNVELRPAVPDLVSAICLKALGYRARAAHRDAVDVWRLLEVARATGLNASAWPTNATLSEVADILRSQFVPAKGRGVLAATTTPALQTRLRLLATSLVPSNG